jgi:hypothetical protein
VTESSEKRGEKSAVIVERPVRRKVVFHGGFNLPGGHALNGKPSSIISVSMPV